jgi:hypothetical protein
MLLMSHRLRIIYSLAFSVEILHQLKTSVLRRFSETSIVEMFGRQTGRDGRRLWKPIMSIWVWILITRARVPLEELLQEGNYKALGKAYLVTS